MDTTTIIENVKCCQHCLYRIKVGCQKISELQDPRSRPSRRRIFDELHETELPVVQMGMTSVIGLG